MKKKDTTITFNELMSELDKYRANPNQAKIVITEQQKKFILSCRNHPRKVPYLKMVELWVKMGWGEIRETSIRNRCVMVLKGKK